MTTCPSCGIAGDNLGCPNHTHWGINPLPDSIPMPTQSAWSSLYAEIGRLNVLLNERDKEIERLKGLMPPDERGPGFVGQGSWSVFAEKVVAERDALREELAEKDKEIERLQHDVTDLQMLRDEHQMDVMHAFQEGGEDDRRKVVAWLRQTSERMNDATLAHAADCIEDGEHRAEES